MKFLHIISRQIALELGLKYYFTGVSCKNGHFDLRRVDTKGCFSCLTQYNKAYAPSYYKNNSESLKEKHKKYYRDNTERVSAGVKAWQKKNQNSLDLHNAEYDAWQSFSDYQKQERIKEKLR